MIWKARVPGFQFEMLGLIPSFLDEHDERSASEQIKAKYIGGWRPQTKFEMRSNGTLIYPSDPDDEDPADPPLKVLCESQLRDEKIYFYDYAWLAVVQPDGSFEVSRLD